MALSSLTFEQLRAESLLGSAVDLAAKFGVSATATRNVLVRAGLTKPMREANRLRYRKAVRVFTAEQEQLILGSLLGDACLCRTERATHSILKLHFAQGHRQLEYLERKRAVIGGSKITKRTAHASHLGGPMFQFAVSDTQALLPYEVLCKVDGKKRVSEGWLAKLDWRGIAYWYQDDASLIRQAGKVSCIRWYTNSFSLPEIDLLVAFLHRHGLTSISTATGNGKPEQRVIVVYRRQEITDFLKQLEPYIVPCLRYKLP